MRTAISTAILIVLLSASTAGAECAWVLWSHSISTKPDFDVWHLKQVMPTNAGCEREKQLTQQAYARQARQSGDVTTAKDTVYLTRGEQTIVFGWYCYPDTIDPRKGSR